MADTALKLDLHNGYRTPFAVSVFFHALLLLVLFFGWNHQRKLDEPPIQTVQAHLVKMTSQAAVSKTVVESLPAKEEPMPDIIRPLQIEKEKVEIEKQALFNKEKQKLEKQKQEKLKKEKLKKEKEQKDAQLKEKQKQEALEQQKREEAARQAQEKAATEKRKAAEALSQALADERSFQQSLSDKELAQSYADRIRQRVEQNWSRPPSAKKGMEVLLEIQLVPTGYVTGVSVLRSSGYSAFDESAQKAVHKAEYFPEIKEVPSRTFEKHFRRFQMLFKVEEDI